MRVDLDQGSESWHAWRAQGIGGSDVGSILGLNPYKSCLQLFDEKIGRAKAQDLSNNSRVLRGQRLENEARLYAQVLLDSMFEPACYEHSGYGFLKSSLDGISPDGKIAIEIKCPSAKTHNNSKLGFIPSYYYAQCQHNLFVSGAELLHYVSFNPGDEDNFISIEVRPQAWFTDKLIESTLIFWQACLEKREPLIEPLDFGGQSFNPETGELI